MPIRFLADSSHDNQITIQGSTTDPLLRLYNTDNGQGAEITFSDHASQSQIGTLKYVHSDTASYGSGNAFILTGTEATLSVLADGKLLFKDGNQIFKDDIIAIIKGPAIGILTYERVMLNLIQRLQ